MRNIIIFIRVYFNFFLFVALMILSLYLLFRYNKYHNAVYSETANEVAGAVSAQYNKVTYYFYLKGTNDSLVKANEALYNRLRQDFEIADTVNKLSLDSIRYDSSNVNRKFLYRQAKVVRNSVDQPNNYIIIHRGRKQGVSNDMGVIAANGGVVGTVVEVSDNFAVVMSLLHSQSSISARLKRGGETGNLVWDGKSSKILLLKDVTKSARISQGDTVITSGFSFKFPEGLVLGHVADIINDKSSSTYTVRVHPSVNFETLQFVYIIENLQRAEPDDLLKKLKSK